MIGWNSKAGAAGGCGCKESENEAKWKLLKYSVLLDLEKLRSKLLIFCGLAVTKNAVNL